MASDPSKSVSQRAIESKLLNERHGPRKNAAEWMLKNICQRSEEGIGQGGNVTGSIDQYTKDLIKRTSAAFFSPAPPVKDVAEGPGTEDTSQVITDALSKALKPVPLGSVVDTATALAKGPLGAAQFMSNTLTSVVDKISSTFTNQLDSAFKNISADGLQHLPSKLMGSVRNLTTAADAILSVPFEMVSDLSNGLLKILDGISNMIDGFVTGISNFFIGVVGGLVDGLFPTSLLMSFFNELGGLSSMVGGLSQMFGGFNVIGDIQGQITGFTSKITSTLSDPMSLVSSYVPQLQQGMGAISNIQGQIQQGVGALTNVTGQIQQGVGAFTNVAGQLQQGAGALTNIMGSIRDPQQALKQFLPPELGNQIDKISKFSGFGFVGNPGFSIGDSFDKLSDGFFQKALGNFADQMPILGPLFNKSASSAAPALTDLLAQGPVEFAKSAINDAQQVGSGGVVQLEDTSKYQIFGESHVQQAKDTLRIGGAKSSLPSIRL
jgi:hypothetical protein